jgi:hypothetical protein
MICITIASWTLTVVGVIVFIPSLYHIIYVLFHIEILIEQDDITTLLTLASCVGITAGLIMLLTGIITYIPPITLPCITIIP